MTKIGHFYSPKYPAYFMNILYFIYYIMYGLKIKPFCIPERGQIKETARVDNLVIPQRAGWITSYSPVVNGYVIQTLNTKL